MSFPAGTLFPSGDLLPTVPGPLDLTDSGQRLYDAIAPLMNATAPGMSDAENGYVGAILCGALATIGLDDAAYVARDGLNIDSNANHLPSFAVLFDVDNVDAKWLPWLAQFVGDADAVQAAPDDATKRSLIKNPAQFTRGRPSTIAQRAQATLTGTKTVLINQRTGSNPWAVSIATFTSETPDPVATKNAILSSMPAWLVPTISIVTGGDYATLAASHSTYTLMEAAHTTYSDIPQHPAA